MKLEDYNMVNNYIYDKIDTDYLLLNNIEKFNTITKYVRNICKDLKNSDFVISKCDNNGILFCIRLDVKKYKSTEIKWFDFYVEKLLMRKRKMKLDKIISLI